jgi:bla regulator protein BlaR1
LDVLLRVGVTNAAWAAVLAVVAALAIRWVRGRPALIHGLWVLVLLKLVMPSLPTVPLPWLAKAETHDGDAGAFTFDERRDDDRAVLPDDGAAVAIVPTLEPPGRQVWRWSPSWRGVLIAVWIAGGLIWWTALARQTWRFQRLLRASRPASEDLRARAEQIAGKLGLRRAPTIEIVPACIPPMLWALFGPARLFLPEDLWARLRADQQDGVLAHELAHLKRRDHWVRRLEAVVLGFFWWDPVAWWALREVERAEEQCCDDWVAWALPRSGSSYAEALVETAAFLSDRLSLRPAGASGIGRVPLLKQRLIMILREPTAGSKTKPRPRPALLAGAIVLLLLPAFVVGQATRDAVHPLQGIGAQPSSAAGPQTAVDDPVAAAPKTAAAPAALDDPKP